jgi:GH25 family lysozyme M1 (1,4-beta-N-acetylmuramidase)
VIEGVDVYAGDGLIPWPALKAAGVEFAYVKLTEGLTWHDQLAADHVGGARAAGIPVGPYHFTRPGAGVEQIDAFVAGIRKIGGPWLPPAVDYEWCGELEEWGRMKVWERRNLIARCGLRMRTLLAADFAAYVGPGFNDDELGDDFPMAGSPLLWVADARGAAPELPRPWSTWTFWQYGGRVYAPGKMLDADRYQGTLAELQARCVPLVVGA